MAESIAIATMASQEPMTKSKKKRMKRAKAQKRKEDEERKQSQSNIFNTSNPLDVIRRDIVELGFELKVVDKAMDEMWTKELEYSDLDAVLNYIQGQQQQKQGQGQEDVEDMNKGPIDLESASATASASASASLVNNDDVAVKHHDVNSNSTTTLTSTIVTETDSPPSPTYSCPSPSEGDNRKEASTPAGVETIPETIPASNNNRPDKIGTGTAINSVETPKAGGSAVSPIKSKAKPFGLAAKLDIVADSEDLTDGIIALTEWVVKAATRLQILQFCSSKSNAKCNALRTVIRRTIQSGNMKYTGQLLDLVGTILRTVGAPSTRLVSCAKALGMLLKSANDACSEHTGEAGNSAPANLNDSIAHSVSKQAVRIIGNVVKEMIDYSKSTNSASVGKSLETEIEQLMASSTGSSTRRNNVKKNIVELMSDRDKSKSLAERYSTHVDTSMKGSEAGKTATQAKADTVDHKSIDESDVMKDMLGADYHAVVSSRARLVELKSQKEQMYSSIPERAELIDGIASLNEDKTKISDKMEQLRAELLKLEAEEKSVSQKIEDKESKLIVLEGTYSVEATKVKEQMDVVSQQVKVEASVAQLARKVCEFASAMETVCSSKPLKNSDKESDQNSDDADIGNDLNCLLKTMTRYFSSELNMLTFLKDRAQNIQNEISTMVSEHIQYENTYARFD